MNKHNLKHTNWICSITSLKNLFQNSILIIGKFFSPSIHTCLRTFVTLWALGFSLNSLSTSLVLIPWCIYSQQRDLLPVFVSEKLKFITLLSLASFPISLVAQESSLHHFQSEFTFFDLNVAQYCSWHFISALDYRIINSLTLIEVSHLKSYILFLRQHQ